MLYALLLKQCARAFFHSVCLAHLALSMANGITVKESKTRFTIQKRKTMNSSFGAILDSISAWKWKRRCNKSVTWIQSANSFNHLWRVKICALFSHRHRKISEWIKRKSHQVKSTGQNESLSGFIWMWYCNLFLLWLFLRLLCFDSIEMLSVFLVSTRTRYNLLHWRYCFYFVYLSFYGRFCFASSGWTPKNRVKIAIFSINWKKIK